MMQSPGMQAMVQAMMTDPQAMQAMTNIQMQMMSPNPDQQQLQVGALAVVLGLLRLRLTVQALTQPS